MEQSDQYSTSSVPRLRVTRNTLTDPTSWRNTFENNSGASEHMNFVAAPMSQDYQSTSEDDFALEEAQGPNTRLLSASLPPADDSLHTSETSHRLRSILERFDKPIRAVNSTSRVSMPPTPSEPDFDFDLEPAQSARHSIRSLIENALREPGDTPQKSKLMRRASFNASDSPRVDKTIRRSLSDEEREAQSQITSQLDTGVIASNSIQPNDQDASAQATTPEKISHHTSKIPFRSGFMTRHRSHKDLEPFRPISSESGLSSPEKNQGRTSKSHQILSNFNPDNFASYLNSDATKESLKSQNLNATNGKAAADNHLRPSSPSLSTSSSRTPSPKSARTETSTKARLLLPTLGSSPTSARSRKLLHKESYGNYKDASERDEHFKDTDPERKREHELERNWNRSRPSLSPMHSMESASQSQSHARDDHNSHDHEKLPLKPSLSRQESGRRASPSVASTSSDEGVEKLYEKERNWNSPKPRHFLQTSRVSHEHSRRVLHGTSPHSPRSHSPNSSSPAFHTPETPFSEASQSQSQQQPIGFPRTPLKERNTDELPDHQRIETPPTSLSSASSTGSLGRGSRPKLDTPSLYDPPTSSDSHPPFSKGHRRTVTELSELTRPSSPAQSFLASDISAETFEPPHMSTPTSKPSILSKLPDVKVSSPGSPSSSTESIGKATVQADLARLHKAIQPDFTFPSPSSAQARDLSPPQESLHDLKDELSSHAAVLVDDTRTPLRHEQSANSTYLKTPNPPGAFGTPYSQVKREAGNSAPFPDTPSPSVGPDSEHNGRDSYVNNDMTTLATPAPPGAYRTTPGTAKRKGILKVVRFDDAETNDTPHEDSADRNLTPELRSQATDTLVVNLESENLEAVTRRKGLRLVDEYGRVRKFTEDGMEVPLDRKGNVSQPDITAQQQSASLSGIEPISVTEQQSMRNTSIETVEYPTDRPENSNSEYLTEPNDKRAVVAHLTKSLGKMQAALAQEEETLATSLSKDKAIDNGRLNSLATVSRTARLEREKLAHRLEAEKNAEGKIQKRLFTARSTSAHTPRGSWWLRRWRLLLLGLILEFCFLYLGYRIALVHSKHLWLGTHFDPFYPALYIHKLQPMILNHPNMLPVNWSVFSVPNTIGNIEMGYTMKDVGKRLWDTAWNWRSVSWDSWGALTPQTWPS